jgi:flagellar protein FliO/FliZ
MIALTLRLVFSLAIVLGLLILCARFAGRRFQGRGDALIQVVHRQSIGRHSAVSVVNVGGRVLVLGSTDQEVRLLAELDPEDVLERHDDLPLRLVAGYDEDEHLAASVATETDSVELHDTSADHHDDHPHDAERQGRPGRHLAPRRSRTPEGAPATVPGGLNGSLLSTRTWRQAWGALTGEAS